MTDTFVWLLTSFSTEFPREKLASGADYGMVLASLWL